MVFIGFRLVFIVILSNQKTAGLGFAQNLSFLGGDQKERMGSGNENIYIQVYAGYMVIP
jgi:hypothetical protein